MISDPNRDNPVSQGDIFFVRRVAQHWILNALLPLSDNPAPVELVGLNAHQSSFATNPTFQRLFKYVHSDHQHT